MTTSRRSLPDQNASTYPAVASAVRRMFGPAAPFRANSASAIPNTPIVIHPSVPECRWVSNVFRSMSPMTLVALKSPMMAVSVRMPSPY